MPDAHHYDNAPIVEATMDLRVSLPEPVYDAFIQVGALTEIEDDWDAEGARAVHADAIFEAQAFLVELACELNGKTVRDICEVNPAVDGGVELYWHTPSGQTALTFRPGAQQVDVQVKLRGQEGWYRAMDVTEALSFALAATLGA